jgi:hypothetical protein
MTKSNPLIGFKFSTFADGGNWTYKVVRYIKLNPYSEKRGYTVTTVDNSNLVEVKQTKFDSKAVFLENAASFIGCYGGIWHCQVNKVLAAEVCFLVSTN